MDSQNQKRISYLVLIIFIIVLVWALSINKSRGPVEKQESEQIIKYGDLSKQIEFTEVPGDLPKDFPLEKGARILRNEIVYFKPVDEIHSTRVYESEKTIADNGAIFEKYLKDKNWKLKGKLDQENLKSFIAEKDSASGILQINISMNSITNKVIVDITLIKKNQSGVDQIGEDSL